MFSFDRYTSKKSEKKFKSELKEVVMNSGDKFIINPDDRTERVIISHSFNGCNGVVFAGQANDGTREVGITHYDPNHSYQNIAKLEQLITIPPTEIIAFMRGYYEQNATGKWEIKTVTDYPVDQYFVQGLENLAKKYNCKLTIKGYELMRNGFTGETLMVTIPANPDKPIELQFAQTFKIINLTVNSTKPMESTENKNEKMQIPQKPYNKDTTIPYADQIILNYWLKKDPSQIPKRLKKFFEKV